jgi:hypothetical protein
MTKRTKKRNPADYGLLDDGDILTEVLMNLVDAGKIVDSGKRRNGQVVWVKVPEVRH